MQRENVYADYWHKYYYAILSNARDYNNAPDIVTCQNWKCLQKPVSVCISLKNLTNVLLNVNAVSVKHGVNTYTINSAQTLYLDGQ